MKKETVMKGMIRRVAMTLAVLMLTAIEVGAENSPIKYIERSWDNDQKKVVDTGDYDQHLQPEPVYYYPGELTLKAQWEITQDWNPIATPLAKQKPQKITKQKPDKEKTIKSRNALRQRK